MKCNPILRWISGTALVVGSVVAFLSATSAASGPGGPAVTPAPGDDSAAAPSSGGCDESRIRSCQTECSHTCRRGPFFTGCAATCERNCRTRYCR